MQQACSTCGYRLIDWTSVLLWTGNFIIFMLLTIELSPSWSNFGYHLLVIAGFNLSLMGIGWRIQRNKLIHKLHSPVGAPSQ